MTSRTLLFIGFIGAALLVSVFNRVTHLSFCGNRYDIPEGCEAESKHQIKCDNCEMSWSYVDGKMLQYAAQQAVSTFAQHRYQPKRDSISCFLVNTKVNAIKITTVSQGCYIVAYGIVNEHSVLVELSLPQEPLTNDQIPEGARKLLRLTY